MKPPSPSSTPPPEDPIRPHTFDGIQEYDKRLPNWWLYTLYGTIVFWVVYWLCYQSFGIAASGQQTIAREMSAIEARRLAATAGQQLDDAALWKMSQNAEFVEAGRTTYATNCTACHLASLRGKTESTAAVGPDLADTTWLHGGRPMEIRHTISQGVLAKGMPAWDAVLGARKVSEVVAYILHHHREGEPVNLAAVAPP